jgi:hypothetical protein
MDIDPGSRDPLGPVQAAVAAELQTQKTRRTQQDR